MSSYTFYISVDPLMNQLEVSVVFCPAEDQVLILTFERTDWSTRKHSWILVMN